MLDQGRPAKEPTGLFNQEPTPPAPEEAAAQNQHNRMQLLRKKLSMGPMSATPVFENQERMFPDSVVVVDTRFQVFSPEKEEDMEAYSSLRISTVKRGAKIIQAEEVKWAEAQGTWKILCKVQTRMFRALTARQEAEIMRETNEPDILDDDPDAEGSVGP
jgi:hypothetical protein